MSCESDSLAPSNKGVTIDNSARANQHVNNRNNSTSRSKFYNFYRHSFTYVAIRDRIPARLVLYFLSCSGFLVSFMMRNDMNFALVAMTNGRNDTALAIQTAYNDCLNSNSTNNSSIDLHALSTNVTFKEEFANTASLPGIDNQTKAATAIESLTNETQNINEDVCTQKYLQSMSKLDTITVYEWSQTVKSIIISSFYVWYVLSQGVGGIATQYFGTKQVFGWSQFATAAASLSIPFCADLHYSVVILLRSIQGFASGLTWPAMYAIVGHWIPLVERSRFMSSFQGFSIGIGLTYPLCGFIIVNFGWRYVFYTTGTLSMCWCICWYLLAYNTPQQHPRITAQELAYIELHVSADATITGRHKLRVPWLSIFRSTATWAIAITTFGRIWIHYIFIVGGPTFMKHILKLDYQKNGFLSGMPFICSYFSSVIFCYIADKMTQARLLNLTNLRKVFTALSQVVPGLLLLRMCYIELNVVHVLVLWFIAVTFITASYAGAMANIVDIAPNFAGPVLAFCQTIHMSASFLSPFVAGQIVTDETQIEQWHTFFILSTIVTIATYLVYQIFGTSEIQKWNFPTFEIQTFSTTHVERNCTNGTTNEVQIDFVNAADHASSNDRTDNLYEGRNDDAFGFKKKLNYNSVNVVDNDDDGGDDGGDDGDDDANNAEGDVKHDGDDIGNNDNNTHLLQMDVNKLKQKQ